MNWYELSFSEPALLIQLNDSLPCKCVCECVQNETLEVLVVTEPFASNVLLRRHTFSRRFFLCSFPLKNEYISVHRITGVVYKTLSKNALIDRAPLCSSGM